MSDILNSKGEKTNVLCIAPDGTERLCENTEDLEQFLTAFPSCQMLMTNELAYAFNRWIASEYSRKAVNIACRFIDLKCDDWEQKSCIWHQKHNFGIKMPADDVYIKDDKERRHSVDSIVLSKEEMNPIAQIIFDGWQGEKKRMAARDSEPVIIIAPPPPEPPKAKPVELPPQEPKPEPKKQRPEWRVKLGVYLSIGTPVILLLSSLLGPPWNTVAKFVWELLKTLNGG